MYVFIVCTYLCRQNRDQSSASYLAYTYRLSHGFSFRTLVADKVRGVLCMCSNSFPTKDADGEKGCKLRKFREVINPNKRKRKE